MDINQLMQMIMQLLTTPPDVPAGDVPGGLPATAAPPGARQMNENDQMMSMLMTLMQQVQGAQSAQQSRNAAAGGMGGMFGSMGGRPPGS